MKFITLHLSQSRARTLLSNFPMTRQDAPHRRRRWRPDVPRRSPSPRSRSQILRGLTKRVARERRRTRKNGKKTRREKGRDGDWERERSVEVTRLHASRTEPRALARASARGEARLRFPRCLPRLSRMLLHAMLLRYTSNIKLEEGMEKRATRANLARKIDGDRQRYARKREEEREREREGAGRKEVERTSTREGEREELEEKEVEGEGGTTQQSCTRRVINICFRSPPPAARWFVSAGSTAGPNSLAYAYGLVPNKRAGLVVARRDWTTL